MTNVCVFYFLAGFLKIYSLLFQNVDNCKFPASAEIHSKWHLQDLTRSKILPGAKCPKRQIADGRDLKKRKKLQYLPLLTTIPFQNNQQGTILVVH